MSGALASAATTSLNAAVAEAMTAQLAPALTALMNQPGPQAEFLPALIRYLGDPDDTGMELAARLLEPMRQQERSMPAQQDADGDESMQPTTADSIRSMLFEIKLNLAYDPRSCAFPAAPLARLRTLLNTPLRQDLPAPRLTDLVGTSVYAEYEAPFNDKTFEPAMLAYFGDAGDDGHTLATQLLGAILAQDLEQFNEHNRFVAPQTLARRREVPEVQRMLSNIRRELVFAPIVQQLVERQAKAMGLARKLDLDENDLSVLSSIDGTLAGHLRDHPDETVSSVALLGLRQIWFESKPIDIEFLKTDTHEALWIVLNFTAMQEDTELKENLISYIFARLVQIGLDRPCDTGCAERLLVDLSTVAPVLSGEGPNKAEAWDGFQAAGQLALEQRDQELQTIIERRDPAYESMVAKLVAGLRAEQASGMADALHYQVSAADLAAHQAQQAGEQARRSSLQAQLQKLPANAMLAKHQLNVLLMKKPPPSTLERKHELLGQQLYPVARAEARQRMQALLERKGWSGGTNWSGAALIDKAIVQLDQANSSPRLAVKFGQVEILASLLAQPGVDVNEVDEQGATALHVAAANGAERAVRMLLAVDGIDTTIEDSNGNTAREIARRKGHRIIAALLRPAATRR
ncbi:MAG: ankyrin repeat domain-containing protein [Janthinobacterium lividum]